ncbi:MAG: MerR family transcriptional regulator [Gaiellaceae bacterium MAG52_C11]|nr:MerR family transcriptional regulator [Candidatus Gaiellasilicea maunaloa]
MNISTLARRAGISPSGIRWYEAAGILPVPQRRSNGYREYTDADCSRLRLILALRRLGLTPDEAGRLVDRCLDGGAPDSGLADMLERQRRRIAQQREELERLERELGDLETSIEATEAARRRSERPPREPIGVLFVCNGNSGRSQIAEALLDRFGEPDFAAWSAGTRPKEVHPLTVRILAEVGIDWSDARAKPVAEFLDRRLDYVITLSNSAREECPTLPGRHSSLHWHLDDPAEIDGAEETRLEAFRATRTELSVRLRPFIEIARRAAGRLPVIAGPEPSRV